MSMPMLESKYSPLVIGGVGGSGTRVYQYICQNGGYKMPSLPLLFARRESEKKWAHDNYLLNHYFCDRWIDPFLSGKSSRWTLRRMKYELLICLVLSGAVTTRRWGWKNPRSIYLLPFFNSVFPRMRFIHIVRDGRDHAFHPVFPYTKHQQFLLTSDELKMSDHIRKGLMWQKTHQLCVDNAARLLQGRYLSCRLEDLVTSPESEIRRIYNFLHCDGEDIDERVERSVRLVSRPVSLGRWHEAEPELIAEVNNVIGPTLVHFGYTV